MLLSYGLVTNEHQHVANCETVVRSLLSRSRFYRTEKKNWLKSLTVNIKIANYGVKHNAFMSFFLGISTQYFFNM